ncbi:MAG: FAD-dependent oxidoreductase, partial [Actinobacteria bacterium]|nr:FAD-dependent oxidoreductase [Actinomycetota bacterium]
VERVRLGDGTTIDTDLVVVGIGVVPRTDLADDCGLDVDNGILADATLASSDPRIFTAGDVANAHHPHYGRHLRVEHWATALHQGPTAARNMLGAGQIYDRLPYFFSDQYDLGMEYVGHAPAYDEVVLRGDVGAREFIAFWLTDGAVTAAMNVNVWDVVDDLERVIRSRARVDTALLRDPETPLDELLGSPA